MYADPKFPIEFIKLVTVRKSLGHYPKTIWISAYGCFWCRRSESSRNPALNSVSLSKSVDPSNSTEPTMIAQQLISLLPDSRPLSLIVRLIFCLKFPNEASRLTISTLTWTVKMKCTALPLLFNLSVGQLMTMTMFGRRSLHICCKNNWLLWKQSKFRFLQNFLYTTFKKCFLTRAQTMPTTSLSYSVFLHLKLV